MIVLANWLFVDIDVLADLERSSIPSVMIARELQTDTVSSVIVDNESWERTPRSNTCIRWGTVR